MSADGLSLWPWCPLLPGNPGILLSWSVQWVLGCVCLQSISYLPYKSTTLDSQSLTYWKMTSVLVTFLIVCKFHWHLTWTFWGDQRRYKMVQVAWGKQGELGLYDSERWVWGRVHSGFGVCEVWTALRHQKTWHTHWILDFLSWLSRNGVDGGEVGDLKAVYSQTSKMEPASLLQDNTYQCTDMVLCFCNICRNKIFNHDWLRLMSFSSSTSLLSHFLLWQVALKRTLQAFWRTGYVEVEMRMYLVWI